MKEQIRGLAAWLAKINRKAIANEKKMQVDVVHNLRVLRNFLFLLAFAWAGVPLVAMFLNALQPSPLLAFAWFAFGGLIGAGFLAFDVLQATALHLEIIKRPVGYTDKWDRIQVEE